MMFEQKELSVLSLLQGIREEDYEQLLNCMGAYTREYTKSDYIVFEGNQINHIGAVLSGTVHMIKEDFWGGKSILSIVSTGNIFGESIVCGGLNSSIVSFQATKDCKILFLPFKHVLCSCSRSCKFHNQLVENMIMAIAQKNIALMEKIEIISKKTIRERILNYLSQQMQKNKTHYFECPMGRVDFANYLCVDRSALTRELSNMKAEGLIDFDHNMFYIKNIKGGM